MTTLPLDQTQDVTDRELHRLTTLFASPDFVKSASRDRTHGAGSLPRHVYADPRNKLYPCHTAPATWVSALFFADKQANFNDTDAAAIRGRIYDAAKYFGISSMVEELEEKIAAANVDDINALPDSDFAIVWADMNGNKDRHWPLRNATEVKYAAEHFNSYRNEFVFEDRQKIAEKILEKAAAYGADVGEHEQTLLVTAGLGACASKVAAEMLQDRAKLVARQNPPAAAELVKLASVLDQNPEQAREHGTLVKLAAAVDEFDRANHLYRLYDAGGLPRAEEVLFAVTEKVARDFMSQNVETTTGNVYALADLEKLAVEDVRNWMGDDFADAVSAGGVFLDRDKLAAIIPTLDRGLATTLDRLMSESKLAAVVQTKAAESLLPLEKLFELAHSQSVNA
jgi:hypothetical protein